MNLGFVGLGIMGAPMAQRLAAGGHTLHVSTRSKVRDEVKAAGAIVCANAQEVAGKSDIIFVMVPDTPDVQAVLFGASGVAAGLSSGKTVVDMSSISPIETKVFAAEVAQKGCDYLDAPVSGGEVGAKAASLTIMVGGPERAFNTMKPVFDKMGKNVTHV
ncbi:MAG: NAD(P)-dependent oxidoreductase, partial [Gammaproteobacteria bacterium]